MAERTATAATDPREHLGPTIRAVRQARGLTLAEVARSADISESWLSQIERGRSVPSIESLYSLASALGVAMHDLFDPARSTRMTVMTEADRPRIVWGDSGAYKSLITNRADSTIDAFVGHFPPGASTGDPYTHGDSSEVLLVLEGEVDAHIDGVSYVLDAGSSLEYRTSVQHQVHNTSSEQASVLWMVSPPTSGSVQRRSRGS